MTLAEHYLARLARLLRLREACLGLTNDAGDRLIERAIDATYSDCCRAGAGDRASVLMVISR